jgi:hypothetical protein
MRFLTTTFLLLISASGLSYAAKGCPQDDYLKLMLSGRFDLCLPLQFYRNAIIGKPGGLLVKLPSGGFFGAEVFSPEMDSLPKTFDMRTYPELALGLKAPSGMTKEQTAAVTNSVSALKARFGSSQPLKIKIKDKTIYTISDGVSTEALIALDEVKDQVLFLNFGKMDEQTVQLILGGVQ